MEVTITIPPSAEPRVKERAAAAGKDVQTFVSDTALEAITALSIDEILEPVRAEFTLSGMTDDELGDFLEDVKHKARADGRSQPHPQ